MQTMARNVLWSRGRFLDPETANDMLDHVSEFLDHLETLTQQHSMFQNVLILICIILMCLICFGLHNHIEY